MLALKGISLSQNPLSRVQSVLEGGGSLTKDVCGTLSKQGFSAFSCFAHSASQPHVHPTSELYGKLKAGSVFQPTFHRALIFRKCL